MKQEYIITNQELSVKNLNLEEYANDTTSANAIIQIALDRAITEVLMLNDNFKYQDDIEKAIDNEPRLVDPFKKLQYQVIYNLVFLPDTDPIDNEVIKIICCDLRWGKLNGWQKNYNRR